MTGVQFNLDEPKHKSLGSKLKTVDFTAKETGDTLEELLQLLDPELHDKKRGQVDKMNTTRLDNAEETKLASLTKKAEDEVDILASQSRKNITESITSFLVSIFIHAVFCSSGFLIVFSQVL